MFYRLFPPPQYLQTLHLQSCDLLDIFGGISFFPLDKMTYLKIQSFVNRMEESLNIVKYTAFLYNDQLIWWVRQRRRGSRGLRVGCRAADVSVGTVGVKWGLLQTGDIR